MRATIRRPIYFVLVMVAGVTSAACGTGDPTGASSASADVRFGTEGLGSGNIVGIDSSASTEASSENTTTADSESAARGGVTFGSGN